MATTIQASHQLENLVEGHLIPSKPSIRVKADIFRYGFMAGRTATILSRYEKVDITPLPEEERELLHHAIQFIDSAIYGMNFLDNKSPPKRGAKEFIQDLNAFGYAIQTIHLLKPLGMTSHKEDMKYFFQRTKTTLQALLQEVPSSSGFMIDIISSKQFFKTLSQILLTDAQQQYNS